MGMMRQVSNTPSSYTKKVESDLHALSMSPKLKAVVRNVLKSTKKPRSKNIVYSNYIGSGLKPISAGLTRKGVSHALFTGKETKQQKAKILSAYNSGKVKNLLVSSSGTEGLDTKGTRSVHVVEPHWNNEKIRQVVARAVRYKSHAHLPKAERHVNITHYHAVKPKAGLLGRMWRKVTGKSKDKTIDSYIYNRARDKDVLHNQFIKAIRRASK
jgi:hypothetical protein